MKRNLLLLCLLPLSLGLLGVDVSTYVDDFSCLRSSDYDFVIVRGYQSFGVVDPNAVATIQNAQAAGMKTIDVYMTPCVPCGNPAAQVQELLSALGSLAAGRTIWLDIEDFQWSLTDLAANQVFIQNLVGNFTNVKQEVGIYTSSVNWNAIVGPTWNGMSSLPLWYSDCDHVDEIKNFEPFGGWTKAYMKQYDCAESICGVYVAYDYQDS